MRHLPPLIAICGIVALILVNTDLYLPREKGVQHPVGTDVVSVYAIDGETSAPPIPVKRLQPDPLHQSSAFSDTGQRVHVYIKNTYRDDDIRSAHTRTIKVLVFFVLLYGVAVLLRCAQDHRKSI